MENQDKLNEIFLRYIRNECSPEEVKLLLQCFETGSDEHKLRELITNALQGNAPKAETVEMKAVYDRVYDRINQSIEMGEERASVPLFRHKIKWAAAAVLVFSIGLYQYLNPRAVMDRSSALSSDIAPGGNNALLTLADGSTVSLNDIASGTHINLASKKKDGQLVYRPGTAEKDVRPEYNTLSTPRGGQYMVILPDETKVWLNAASSLKFPVVFSDSTREVELMGEAYFEVAKRTKGGKTGAERVPFIVRSGTQQIEVLGTSFNVMAYEDEPFMKTTLLEGNVKISNLKTLKSNFLIPGQQSHMDRSGSIEIAEVNTEEEAAWKDGYFDFRRDNIQDIMRELSRWYDVEVIYQGRIPRDEYVGKIRRSVTLSQALKMLKISHVRFKIKGRKIIIKGQST